MPRLTLSRLPANQITDLRLIEALRAVTPVDAQPLLNELQRRLHRLRLQHYVESNGTPDDGTHNNRRPT